MPLSRRKILAAMAGAPLLSSGARTAFAASANPQLPNILWLVSEDNNPFIGAYGDKAAHTPNLDALAAQGILYRNVYSSAPVCSPSRFGILTGAYPESCSPAQHMRATAKLPSSFRTYPEYMRSAGYYCTNNSKTDYNCDVDPDRIWDVSGDNGHWRNRPEGAPFLAVFNYMTTHESSLFRPVPGSEAMGPIRIPGYLPPTPAIENDYAKYYKLMSIMDGQIGDRLAELEADGLADNTIVFYYSDNGGVLPRSKRYCYDEGLRVAMIVRVPPKWQHLSPAKPGSVIDTPVTLLDLPPTLLALANMGQPAHMQGNPIMGSGKLVPNDYVFGMRNRMDERYDFVRTVADGRYRYIRNYMPHRIWGMRGDFEWILKSYQSWEEEHIAGRLNADQDRFFQTKPYEELYDLAEDPDQLSNLVSDAVQSARLAQLRTALDRHMLKIRDNGFIPEGSDAEGYDISQQDSHYPLKQIMVMAQAAARGDVRKLALLQSGLKNRNGVVRYWAATGLLILKQKAKVAEAALARAAAEDPWLSVRVVCAEALCHLRQDDKGQRILGEIIVQDIPFPPRLQALNALDALGEASRPALDAIMQVQDDKNEYIVRAARPLLAKLEGTYRPDISYGRGTTAKR
ncbi:hypothetical protein RLDS_06060 [Sphingobium lactosutens DS20]|uniref:Sulfatase N-terminal domain-containing protein n=2 Tax=Sphingobium TaxID=165695 RepID=T0IYN2_9SPHN|nr:hypothetical protein RLDS_06060 [Sphingobium lactosutens DS20]